MTTKNNAHRKWHKRNTTVEKITTGENTKDEDVMISTSIKDLEAMLEGVESNTKTTFEKMFLPALIVFSLLALGGFLIIYSITTDMSRLAVSMDPNMGKNMTSMERSINNLSQNVAQMTRSVQSMDNNFKEVNEKMAVVVVKMDNLDSINSNLDGMQEKLSTLKPMLSNMNHMNKSMLNMDKTMQEMGKDIGKLRYDFGKPMKVINSMPFM
jgi:ABC-type multidrug transport system fused ATPase/permease subunit